MIQYQRETLIVALQKRGITYLAPSDAHATEILPTDEDLIIAILNQSDSRLHLALVTLFIRWPALANYIPTIVGKVSANAALQLQMLYMAAAYLQRLWRTRLSFYMEQISLLPDLYSAELHLPPVDERFGKSGLHAVADLWATHSLFPFNRLASLNKVIELLFEQLKMEHPIHESTSVG